MQNAIVPKSDKEPNGARRFSVLERIILASGALALSLWIGGLAWVGYKLVTLII